MNRLIALIAVTTWLVPALAHAEATPAELLAAMDVPEFIVLPGSVDTDSPLGEATAPEMYDVVGSLGAISAMGGPAMALLSTGNAATITAKQDTDFPPGGEQGDQATLSLSLMTPEWAQSLWIDFYFLSREYPEWVGNIYNDGFQIFVTGPAFTGQVAFDDFGNGISVNNALFQVRFPEHATELAGTGFDESGGTGWLTTVVPVTGGSQLDLTFTIYDEADGVWDSAVLIDGVRLSTFAPAMQGPHTGPRNPRPPAAFPEHEDPAAADPGDDDPSDEDPSDADPGGEAGPAVLAPLDCGASFAPTQSGAGALLLLGLGLVRRRA